LSSWLAFEFNPISDLRMNPICPVIIADQRPSIAY